MLREWILVGSAFSCGECDSILARTKTRPRALGGVGRRDHPSPDGPFKVDSNKRRSEVAFIGRDDPEFADVFTKLDDLVEDANSDFFGVRYHRRLRLLQFTVYQGHDDEKPDFYRGTYRHTANKHRPHTAKAERRPAAIRPG